MAVKKSRNRSGFVIYSVHLHIQQLTGMQSYVNRKYTFSVKTGK